MDRVIKFKLWHKTKKKWCNDFSESSLTDDGEPFLELQFNKKLFDLVQFTGKLDKNGQEIYEKDILGYGDNYPCVVEWDNEESRYVAVENSPTNERYYPRTHDLNYQTVPWERLGSVYDSPELIKK